MPDPALVAEIAKAVAEKAKKKKKKKGSSATPNADPGISGDILGAGRANLKANPFTVFTKR